MVVAFLLNQLHVEFFWLQLPPRCVRPQSTYTQRLNMACSNRNYTANPVTKQRMEISFKR